MAQEASQYEIENPPKDGISSLKWFNHSNHLVATSWDKSVSLYNIIGSMDNEDGGDDKQQGEEGAFGAVAQVGEQVHQIGVAGEIHEFAEDEAEGPTCNDEVIRQDHHSTEHPPHANEGVDFVLAEGFEGTHGIAFRVTSYGQLGHHHWETNHEAADEIDHDKGGAAIVGHFTGVSPNIAKADR